MYNSIKVKSLGRGIEFDLELRYPKIVIDGNSSTGKSLLVSILRENLFDMSENFLNLPEYFKKIDVYDFTSDDVDLTDKQNRIIVIDNYDYLSTKFESLSDTVRVDTENQYIIIGRNTDKLQLSLSCYAKMTEDHGVFKLKYFEDR